MDILKSLKNKVSELSSTPKMHCHKELQADLKQEDNYI